MNCNPIRSSRLLNDLESNTFNEQIIDEFIEKEIEDSFHKGEGEEWCFALLVHKERLF